MTFLSLFSGIGGLDLGLERAGMRCIGQVEIDPFCRKVLAKHWPNVPRMEDVRDVKGNEFGPIDLIAGGFPCQDISDAGRRKGIDGDRSGLWTEYIRIIRKARPRNVLVENVSALLHRGIGRVLADLASCGFDAEWQCLPSAAFGTRFLRDRIFILGSSRPMDDFNRVFAGSLTRYPEAVRRWLSNNSIRSCRDGTPWANEPGMGRVAYGISNRVDRHRALGNAVVPAVAEYIGRAIMQAAGQMEAA